MWSSEIRRESGALACPAFVPSRLSDALLGIVTKKYVEQNATNDFLIPAQKTAEFKTSFRWFAGCRTEQKTSVRLFMALCFIHGVNFAKFPKYSFP